MKYWVYKSSMSRRAGQNYGDWERVFSGKTRLWGSLDRTPELTQLSKGHHLLCFQSNRNEIVGIARVIETQKVKGSRHLKVAPVERIGVKVRPLKERDARIRGIKAFHPGIVATIYDIKSSDALYLLRIARREADENHSSSKEGAPYKKPDGGDDVSKYLKNAQGFEVDPRVRKAIEKAAVKRARNYYEKAGYEVHEHGKPFDLQCARNGRLLYVEVKGTQTKGAKIFLTPNEVEFAWDNPMELFLVHSMKVMRGPGAPKVSGGVEKVKKPWRPVKKRLTEVMYSYKA